MTCVLTEISLNSRMSDLVLSVIYSVPILIIQLTLEAAFVHQRALMDLSLFFWLYKAQRITLL